MRACLFASTFPLFSTITRERSASRATFPPAVTSVEYNEDRKTPCSARALHAPGPTICSASKHETATYGSLSRRCLYNFFPIQSRCCALCSRPVHVRYSTPPDPTAIAHASSERPTRQAPHVLAIALFASDSVPRTSRRRSSSRRRRCPCPPLPT